MTEAPTEGVPTGGQTADLAAVIDELKKTNVVLIEKLGALEEKSKAQDQRIAALTMPPASNAEKERIDAAKSDFEIAYRAALERLGFKED